MAHLKANRTQGDIYLTNYSINSPMDGITNYEMTFNGYVTDKNKGILDAVQNWMYRQCSIPDFRSEWMCYYCGTPQKIERVNCSQCGAPRNWIF